MTKGPINLQDIFLHQIKKENVPVTIYLVNGVQLRGSVRGYDNFTVFLEFEGKVQLVYKHAVTTISPARPLAVNVFAEAFKDYVDKEPSAVAS
ncbi:MAG: RNA chaperone Hfq [Armatimonadetes bacterium]|nr:RNA chaperone Hfq [Armatimonadota bacterium]